MSVPLLLLLLAPLVGAVVAIAFAEVPSQRRILVALCGAAILGGAAAALVRSAATEAVAWRGFTTDAWTALLALGAVASIVAGIARAGARHRPGPTEAALFAAAAAGVAPLLVRELHLLAVTLPVSTLAFASAAVVSSRRAVLGLAQRRAIAALALSDVAALLAIGTAVSSGTTLPPELSTTAGVLLLGAVALRLGLVPLWLGAGEASRADPALEAIWLGPIRAQGLLLIPAAVAAGPRRRLRGSGGRRRHRAAVLRTRAAQPGSRSGGDGGRVARGARDRSGRARRALGRDPVRRGGLRLGAGMVRGRSGSVNAIRPTVGVLPAGALLPGAVLVVGGGVRGRRGAPGLPGVRAAGARRRR